MNADGSGIRVVHGSRAVSAGRLRDQADELERALSGALGRAGYAGGAGAAPERPGAQFDVEFAGLTELVRGAFDATARTLRDHAAKNELSEQNYARAEQAGLESAERVRTGLEEL
ncbi:hypothetical protein [Nonomuraea gerenzanensis]|uniref:Uncharacterized protein n=1 Tax=Nonomuraea gerenzanensis TaxID=93944 RepID=A0A1M4E152_9ACTN|nr:hypothetical protein [Nonomuraea gerenzanensis]UBU14779.1 hypothetical protein LCN96_07065 [Nonomuraea gerenzanensis]SBO92506.1 hypothetical protein BN4615_P2020 [Nonomuraea gerenzanensis]